MRFSSGELNSETHTHSLFFKELQPLTRYETQALTAGTPGSSVIPQQSSPASRPSPAHPARPRASPQGRGEEAAAAAPAQRRLQPSSSSSPAAPHEHSPRLPRARAAEGEAPPGRGGSVRAGPHLSAALLNRRPAALVPRGPRHRPRPV